MAILLRFWDQRFHSRWIYQGKKWGQLGGGVFIKENVIGTMSCNFKPWFLHQTTKRMYLIKIILGHLSWECWALSPPIARPPPPFTSSRGPVTWPKPGGEGGRGGDPLLHRSRDTSLIGGEMRALGLLLPYAVEGTYIHTEYTPFLRTYTAGP